MQFKRTTKTTDVIAITLTIEEANALSDALSYYNGCAERNFDMGYGGEEGKEALRAHRKMRSLANKLVKALDA